MTHELIHIGLYVIFGFIMLPVYVMIGGWLLGKPRRFRSVAMTFAYMFTFLGVVLVGMAVLGMIISFFTPY